MVDDPNYDERFRIFEQSVEVGAVDQAWLLADLLVKVEKYRARVERICKERLPARVQK